MTVQRARVIATSAVTWLIVAQLAGQAIVDEFGDTLPAPWLELVGRAVVLLAGVVAVIRRVTPVMAEDRGLL